MGFVDRIRSFLSGVGTALHAQGTRLLSAGYMFREILATYRETKKKRDINWFTEWICRPQAAALVYFLKGTPVTSNQITLLSLIVCAAAGAMLVFLPGHLWLLVAAAVFEFSFILDCVDGQLARARKVTSTLGHLFDFLVDEIKAMLLFGCVTIRLWREAADVAQGEMFLLAGLAGLFALASGISITAFTRRSEYGAPPPTEDGQPAVIQRRRGVIGVPLSLLEHAARIVVHYPSYIWLAAAFNRIDVYFWAYAGVNVLYLARMLLAVSWRLCRFDRSGPVS